MASNRKDLQTAAWKRLRNRLRAQRLPCALCGAPIDYDAAPRTRWAFSVDHVVPVSVGGDVDMVQAAHFGCNGRKSNRVERQRSKASRRW
jgi:5-methylcytosine-specific restriction endonuclease McrA